MNLFDFFFCGVAFLPPPPPHDYLNLDVMMMVVCICGLKVEVDCMQKCVIIFYDFHFTCSRGILCYKEIKNKDGTDY